MRGETGTDTEAAGTKRVIPDREQEVPLKWNRLGKGQAPVFLEVLEKLQNTVEVAVEREIKATEKQLKGLKKLYGNH